jgi:hypothetical protein
MLPFIYFIKDEVVDKMLKQPMTQIEHTQSKHTKHQTQREQTTFILLLMVALSKCEIWWGSDYPQETPRPSPGLWRWRTKCPCRMHKGCWPDPLPTFGTLRRWCWCVATGCGETGSLTEQPVGEHSTPRSRPGSAPSLSWGYPSSPLRP